MRVAFGCCVFFSPFVQNYSNKIKHLSDLTKASFDWNESTSKHDNKQQFEISKLPAAILVPYSIRTILSHILRGQTSVNFE